MDEYPGQIRFEYHPYPYSDFGFKIAEALEAAGDQGKFWEMHNALIDDVPQNDAELKALAEKVGLDIGLFDDALARGEYRAKIESAIKESEAMGVTEVALFINGKEYQAYPGTFDDLCRAIETELERAGENGGN